MTEDVLVTISGKHLLGGESEDVELLVPGRYRRTEDGVHEIYYEEPLDDTGFGTENTLRIDADSMCIEKHGACTAELRFLNSVQRTLCEYRTPYGVFMIRIKTSDLRIDVSEDCIRAKAVYAMDVEEEFLKDCEMEVEIRARRGDDSEA